MPGEEAVAPELRADDGFAGAEHDEPGEVLVHVSEAVAEPRSVTRADRLGVAGVHHQQRRLVVGHVRVHAAEDADIVDALADFGEEFGHFDAGLPVLLELEGRPEEGRALAAGCLEFVARLLAVLLREFGLGVESIDLARPAVHEEVDDALGLGGEVRRLDPQRRRRCGLGFLGEDTRESEDAESGTRAGEHLAAVECERCHGGRSEVASESSPQRSRIDFTRAPGVETPGYLRSSLRDERASHDPSGVRPAPKT